MKTITIIIFLIIETISSVYFGYSLARLKTLDGWEKMLNKLDAEKVNFHFGQGALWAYEIVEKGGNDDYEHKTG